MYSKILVGLDNSEVSESIFKQALELARANQAAMMLVHGLSSDEDGSPMPVPPEVDSSYLVYGAGADVNFDVWRQTWEQYESEGLDRLRRFAAIARESNVLTEFRQISGPPSKVICRLAQQWNADLIVIGNRGRSGLTELMLGSVSNDVMHRAPCSVLVLKEKVVASSQTETSAKASV